MTNCRTPGDLLFEEYLEFHGYDDWEYEPLLQGATSPDYRVTRGGVSCICEVTAFARDAGGDLQFGAGARTRTAKAVFAAQRNKLRDKARQLKPYANLGCPLIIVLTNPAHAMLHLSDQDLAYSMYGDPTWKGMRDERTGEIVGDVELVAGRNGQLTRDHPYISGVARTYSRPVIADYLDQIAEDMPASSFQDRVTELKRAIRSGEISETDTYPATDLFLARSESAVPVPTELFDAPPDRRFIVSDAGAAVQIAGPVHCTDFT